MLEELTTYNKELKFQVPRSKIRIIATSMSCTFITTSIYLPRAQRLGSVASKCLKVI